MRLRLATTLAFISLLGGTLPALGAVEAADRDLIAQVGQTGPASMDQLDRLRALVQSDDPAIQVAAINVLAKYHDDGALGALAQAVASTNPKVAAAAAAALKPFSPKDYGSDAAGWDAWHDARSAQFAARLEKIRPKLYDADATPQQIKAGIQELLFIKDDASGVIGLLEPLLNHADEGVRRTALAGIRVQSGIESTLIESAHRSMLAARAAGAAQADEGSEGAEAVAEDEAAPAPAPTVLAAAVPVTGDASTDEGSNSWLMGMVAALAAAGVLAWGMVSLRGRKAKPAAAQPAGAAGKPVSVGGRPRIQMTFTSTSQGRR